MERPRGSRERNLNFSSPLSDLGAPDEQFSRYRDQIQRVYGCGGGYPGLAKWIVQKAARRPRKLHFCALRGLFYIGFERPIEEYVDDDELEEGDFEILELLHRSYEDKDDDDDHQPQPELFEPHAYEAAEVHFTGKTLDGTVFASSMDNNGAPLTFKFNQEDIMPGFALATASMQPGEKAIFTIPPEFAMTMPGCPASISWNIPPKQTLRFDIQLISLITNIVDDQGILKKTIKFGRGKEHPCDFDEVFVKYNACLKDGTSVSKSEMVRFTLGKGFFCPAIAQAVKTMTKGEKAVLIIKPEYGFGEQGRISRENEAAVPPGATLHVSLQLISWVTVSYIGENRDILKRTLRKAKSLESDGARHLLCGASSIRPYNEAIVKVRLIGKLQDGTIFDRRGHDGEKPFQFTIDQEHVIYGLDEAVLTVHVGEVAFFTIPPQHAFGVTGSNQHQLAVPPNSFVFYEVELLFVDNGAKWLGTMTSCERLHAAWKKEKEGDDLFKSGKYLRAYRKYLRAVQIIRWNIRYRDLVEIHPLPELIWALMRSVECMILLERYKQALDHYYEVWQYEAQRGPAEASQCRKNFRALQMMARNSQNSSIQIDTAAMLRGLEVELQPMLVMAGLLEGG